MAAEQTATGNATSSDGPTRGSVAGAGVTGGSVGTALAAYASSLKDGDLKTLLTVSAPLISIGVSGLWLFVKIMWIDPYMAKQRDQAFERKARNLEQSLRKDLEEKIG